MLLRALGGLSVDGDALTRTKPLLLLTFLALEGPQTRYDVAGLFWPRAADPRNRLSVVVHRVNKVLPDAIAADADSVATHLRTDVHDVRDALLRRDLKRVDALYGGAFLAGVQAQAVSEGLQEWILETREALAAEVRTEMLYRARRAAAERRFEVAAANVEMALAVAGAAPLEPSDLTQAYTIALAGGARIADRLRRDAEDVGVTVTEQPAEARAQLAAAIGAGNLPRRVSSFVGRSWERVELASRIGEDGRPIVTLIGPGGIGKTRLALELARDRQADGAFPGGVWFVPLSELDAADEVIGAVADAIGVVRRAGEDDIAAVVRTVESRRTLLVLDNLDHLTGAASDLVRLIQRCPQLFVLATSRRRLEVEEESVVPVGGLPVPPLDASPERALDLESVRLFIERARRARLDFEASPDDVRAIAELCRRFEGMPLAIELAAIGIRDRTPAQVASELGDDLDRLASRSRTIASRHRSLRASFEYSLRLLMPEERDLLARLAVFRGGFSEEHAVAVTGASPELLARLVDRSLLQRDDAGRFDVHPVIAAFARERLEANEPVAATGRADHARTFGAYATRQAGRMHGSEQVQAMQAFARERANLRAAASWAVVHDADLALELAYDRSEWWRFAGHYREGLEAAEAALARAADSAPRALVAGHVAAGAMAYRLGDFGHARRHLVAAIEAAPSASGPTDDRGAWRILGDVAHAEADYEAASEYFERALQSAMSAGDEREELASVTGIGRTAAARGDLESARHYLTHALKLSERRGSPALVATAYYNLGALARDAGASKEAEPFFLRALEHDELVGDRSAVAATLRELAAISLGEGDTEVAQRRYEEALSLATSVGDVATVASLQHALGKAALTRGNLNAAIVRFQAALDAWRTAGQAWRAAPVAADLATVAAQAGHLVEAARFLGVEEALRALRGDADVRSADALPNAPTRAEVRGRLGSAAYERAYAEGRGMDLVDAARSYARGVRTAPRARGN